MDTFALLFLVALGFWWLAGRLIDDVLDSAEDVWSRAKAHERLGHEAERRRV